MNQQTEEWRPIVTQPGYSVSSHGRVRNDNTGRIRKLQDQNGYKSLRFSYTGPKTLVHRLVARAFIGESELDVNHKDLNPSNNHFSNLEYVSARENTIHAYRIKPWCKLKKLTREQVLEIRSVYETGEYSQQQVAELFGISQARVCNIVNRKHRFEVTN